MKVEIRPKASACPNITKCYWKTLSIFLVGGSLLTFKEAYIYTNTCTQTQIHKHLIHLSFFYDISRVCVLDRWIKTRICAIWIVHDTRNVVAFKKYIYFDVINDMFFSFFSFFSPPGVGIGVPAAAAVQPAQQAPAAQQPAQAASMQPQATPQHQQLLMKQQQQASPFLSPQGNQQVGILAEQEWKYVLATLSVFKSLSGMLTDGVWQYCVHVVTHFQAWQLNFQTEKQYQSFLTK